MKKIIQEYGLFLIYFLIALVILELLSLFKYSCFDSFKTSAKIVYPYSGQYDTYLFQIIE